MNTYHEQSVIDVLEGVKSGITPDSKRYKRMAEGSYLKPRDVKIYRACVWIIRIGLIALLTYIIL